MNIAPLRNKKPSSSPWEGDCPVKPWDYQVTACIPVLDTPEELELVISLLRLQSVKPFIIVVDTGSTPENLAKIQRLASVDLEVHSLRLLGVLHPSDFVSFAMDLCHAICRSPYMFCTHADCFLMNQFVISELLGYMESYKVAGYEMSPRPHKDWVGMVGHTCTMYEIACIDYHGISWSQRRLCAYHGISSKPDASRPNYPDTEVGFNVLLRNHSIEAFIIGKEENYERTLDHRIDHCRTLTSGKLYSPEYYAKAIKWVGDAMLKGWDRVKEWESSAVKHLN